MDLGFKKRIIVFLIFLVLVSGVQGVCVGPKEVVKSSLPIIRATFDETVSIQSYKFIGSVTGDVSLIGPKSVGSEGNSYEYEASAPLTDPFYEFNITAVDLFGNKVTKTKCYEVRISPIDGKLINPEYGVSTSENFDIEVETDLLGKCRYVWLVPRRLDQMVPFNQQSFSIKHSAPFSLRVENDPRRLFVACERKDGIINDGVSDVAHQPLKFGIMVDKSKPVINSVFIEPGTDDVVTEYAGYTEIKVKTDELVRCKYSASQNTFELMENDFNSTEKSLVDGPMSYDDYLAKFGRIVSSFGPVNVARISPIVDGESRTYNIACENQAGLVSDTVSYTFNVNFNATEKIKFLSPPTAISSTPISVNVSTNKVAASCLFGDDLNALFSPLLSADGKIHTGMLSTLVTEGSYDFYTRCSFVTSGNDVTEMITVKFDKTPPIISNISLVESCVDDKLSVKWDAVDLLSEIDEFDYELAEDSLGQKRIVNGSTDQFKLDFDVKGLNVSQYFLRLKATDTAGNVGPFSVSQPLVPQGVLSTVCSEKVKPLGTLYTSQVGGVLNVGVNCTDPGVNASGCNDAATLYGTALSGVCTPTQVYSSVIPISQPTTVCFKVFDFAGNVHAGESLIDSAVDADVDGVIDGVDLCPGTTQGMAVDANGCADDQRDSDGDGVNDNLDQCNNHPNGIEVDTVGCPKDSDLDGMPDYWEEQYGLDPFDPTDKDGDPDNDTRVNLDEYLAGTDPNVADVALDSDGDGVLDGDDECPDTAQGERVNSKGCSKNDLDKDGDGILDSWEVKYCNGDCDPLGDLDDDGLNNLGEFREDTDPTDSDTDGDGFSDGSEVNKFETDPLDSDDHPVFTIVGLVLFILGILLVLAGLGYVAYKKFFKHPVLESVGPVTGGGPSVSIKSKPGSKLQVLTKLPPKHTRHKKSKHKKLSDAVFDGFSEDSIHKIKVPSKKIKKVEKKPKIIEEKKPEKVEELSPFEIIRKMNRENSSLGKITKLNLLNKSDVSKLLSSKDKVKVKKIFENLSKVNKGESSDKRGKAFFDLSKLATERKVDDVVKDLPEILKPKSKKEVEAFKMLNELAKGKDPDLKKLEKYRSNEDVIERVKKLAKR